jgi:NDP-sugar pyrophosphorylase family protein
LNYDNIHVLILSAGKIEKELESVFGSIPSGLIPLHGKPVIFRIIDKLLKEGFKKISITTGFKKEILEKIISEQYSDQIKLNFITTDFEKPPGNSILTAIEKMQEQQLLVILGDTLVENEFSNLIQNNNDFVLISENFETPANWCIVTLKDGKLDLIFDKKKNLEKTNEQYALVGVYYFDDLKSLKRVCVKFNEQERIEISDLIKKYKEQKIISTEVCKQWYDAGHVENYFVSKQMLLKARYFNSLRFDRSSEIVTKTSENILKLIDEIEWYKQIPNDLSKLIPKIKEFDQSKKPFLKLEYIKHPTLAELWLYGDFSSKLWIEILKKLFEILNQFKKYSKSVSLADYNLIYKTKTEDRMQELTNSNESFRHILASDMLFINGKKYRNWPVVKEEIELKIHDLYHEKDNCLIHGDLCFSNIFCDFKNKNFKLIDPRGKWGSDMYGDIKYDVAKIRHSIIDGFDTITNGLYSASLSESNHVAMKIFKPKNHQEVCMHLDNLIQNKWNLNEIKLIEGLLFISMLPLHKDHFERQLAFYSIGIQLLNEVLDETDGDTCQN